MNTNRQKEIIGSAIALTAVAALATGLVATQNAYAAPVKETAKRQQKSTVRVQRAKKPVYVKITGDRRAAQVRADQLYAQAMSEAAAQRETEALLAQQQQESTNNTSVAMNENQVPVAGQFPGTVNAGPGITFTNNPFSGYVGYGPGSVINPNFGYGGFNGFAGSMTGNNYVVVPGGFFGGGPGFQIGNYSPTGITLGLTY